MLWVLLAVVVVGGLIWWTQRSDNSSQPSSYLDSSTSPTPTVTSGKKATTAKSITTPTAPANNTNYGTLRAQYDSTGHLLTFDDSCRVTPGQIVLKTGTKIMLDNRSAIAKTIRLDNDSFSLPAYNYRIVQISPAHSLPYDLGVDCKSTVGNTENGAVLKVQALISNGL